MAKVVYPPRMQQRILASEAPGGEPASVALVAPTVAVPGEPVRLTVAATDADGYPSLACDGVVRIRGPLEPAGAVEVPFRAGEPAVARVEGVALRGTGLVRLEALLAGRTWPSNPVCLREHPAERIYWGDPHVHTVLSRCHPERCRSVPFAYTAARCFAGLDWVSATDHVSNGRCDLGAWKEEASASEAHDDPPEFATLPGYEASLKGGAGGDTNVYMRRWPAMFVDEYESGDVRTLCAKLAETLGDDFFVVPHHTTRTGKHGEIPDAIYPGPDLMPVIEIHSKWGTSEYRGNPDPLHQVHPGPSYAADLLARGLRLGFIGGTDTHATMPAGFGREPLDRLPGLTAVRATRLHRDAVFDAIRARRCYATSLERIYLDVHVAGAAMGETHVWSEAPGPRRIEVTAAASSDLETLEVVRNGKTVHTDRPTAWRGSVAWEDEEPLERPALDSPHLGRFVYYYVRATCTSGARAWSSPVWLVEQR